MMHIFNKANKINNSTHLYSFIYLININNSCRIKFPNYNILSKSKHKQMFKGIFENIMGTISNLNPLKRFIKYALDKTLNELLKK